MIRSRQLAAVSMDQRLFLNINRRYLWHFEATVDLVQETPSKRYQTEARVCTKSAKIGTIT